MRENRQLFRGNEACQNKNCHRCKCSIECPREGSCNIFSTRVRRQICQGAPGHEDSLVSSWSKCRLKTSAKVGRLCKKKEANLSLQITLLYLLFLYGISNKSLSLVEAKIPNFRSPSPSPQFKTIYSMGELLRGGDTDNQTDLMVGKSNSHKSHTKDISKDEHIHIKSMFIEIIEVEEEKPPPPPPINNRQEENSTKSTHFYNKTWRNATTNETCLPPNEIQAPTGFEYTSDWMIEIGNQSNKKGWEEFVEEEEVIVSASYSLGLSQYRYIYKKIPKRKRCRRWLRKITPILHNTTRMATGACLVNVTIIQNTTGLNVTTEHRKSVKRKKRKSNVAVRVAQAVKDDFTFKGCGWSFVKSLIFPNVFGVTFRLPLSLNFASLEQRNYLPSVSSSFSFFYPWTISTALNFSLPCEYLWHVTMATIRFVQRLMLLFLLVFTPRSFRSSEIKPPLWDIQTYRFSKNVQERLGIGLSWRYSQRRGYEFRCQTWYLYLPSIEYLHQTANNVATSILGDRTKNEVLAVDPVVETLESTDDEPTNEEVNFINKKAQVHRLREWLRQRTAALGVSTSYPIPDPPFYAANAVFALNGYYYSDLVKYLKGFRSTNQKYKTSKKSAALSSSFSDSWGGGHKASWFRVNPLSMIAGASGAGAVSSRRYANYTPVQHNKQQTSLNDKEGTSLEGFEEEASSFSFEGNQAFPRNNNKVVS